MTVSDTDILPGSGATTSRNGQLRPEWSLRLLDGWALIRRPGSTPAIAGRERRLLTLLALRGGRDRGHVASVLWPDSDECRAHGNLRAAVWHLQHQHAGVLADEHGFLALAPSVRVDVHELRAAVGSQGAGPAPPPGVLLRLLCHGDLLPGWSDTWVEEERALLHQYRLRGLESLSERLLEDGDLSGAMTAAMRAVAIDPLRESAHRVLILIHLRDGNHAEAVRVYDALRDRLRDELGVGISARLSTLIRAAYAGPVAITAQ
jgi:DNA-binding SARP family transcriptional activator